MAKSVDFSNHLSILMTQEIEKILRPLKEITSIKHFRYLKVYKTGKRILFSNYPDIIRYTYGDGNYIHLWFDGEFPAFIKNGWHSCQDIRALDQREIEEKIVKDFNDFFGIFYGLSYIQISKNYYEVFTFESENPDLYAINKSILLRFILYFRQQAKKILKKSEKELIITAKSRNVRSIFEKEGEDYIKNFIKNTPLTRYYLNSKNEETYLTPKELDILHWFSKGKFAAEIAKMHNCATKTIHRHIENIKLKLACSKQAELTKTVLKSGILDIYSEEITNY